MMAVEEAAGMSATLGAEALPAAATDVELEGWRRTGDGTETGLGAGADEFVEAELELEVGLTVEAAPGSAPGLGEFGCPKTEADTGTKVGRWAGRSGGWFGLEALVVSFSRGLQMTLLTGRGDSLGAETRTEAGTGTEAARDRGTGVFTAATADTRTAIAFSMRL